jgi:hypothetical protein
MGGVHFPWQGLVFLTSHTAPLRVLKCFPKCVVWEEPGAGVSLALLYMGFGLRPCCGETAHLSSERHWCGCYLLNSLDGEGRRLVH